MNQPWFCLTYMPRLRKIDINGYLFRHLHLIGVMKELKGLTPSQLLLGSQHLSPTTQMAPVPSAVSQVPNSGL